MHLRSITRGLRRLFRKDEAENDLRDEVAHYLEMAAADHMGRGMTRDQAERAARLEFGGVEAVKENVRAAGWESGIETLWQDVRYAWRGLRRNLAFTAVAVLTLALGIGANTAMFSVVSAVMLRPLPYRDPGRLALLWTDDVRRGLHQEGTAYRTIVDWRTNSRRFTDIAFFGPQSVVLSNGSSRERTKSAFVSANVFSVLGVGPILGRAIGADDESRRDRVAVISYALWQHRFGGDSSVIGKTLEIEQVDKGAGTSPTIIGVMPAGFFFPDKQTSFWIPATTYWRWDREANERLPEWTRRWTAVGRLADHVTLNDARAELAGVGRRLAIDYPSPTADFPGFTPNIVPMLDHVTGVQLQFALWVLLGAVGLVLLVACANVANLLLARGATRYQEFAIRRALGAGRARLVRQLLVESVMLSAAGGLAGVALAIVATKWLALAAAARIPRADEVTIDGAVLLFAALLSVVAGIAFGIVPAFRMSRVSPSEALKEGGQATGGLKIRRTRAALVVAECAFAIVLLAGAGLLIRSLQRVQSIDPGFKADGVLSLRIELPRIAPPPSSLGPTFLERGWGEQVLHDLSQRIAGLPGVENVSFADDIFVRGEANESITFPGRPADALASGQLYTSSATPGFLEMMGVPLHRGRYLNRDDALTKIRALWFIGNTDWTLAEKEQHAIHEPVVVNDAFVRRFLPNEDPIGKTFCIDPTNKTYWYVIVGVVGDMRRQGLERQAIPEYFQTFIPAFSTELLVRARGDPLALAPTVRRLVSAALPGALVLSVTTADRRLGDFSAERRFQTWLLALFASLALVLAGVGIYGVVHYAVAERTREIGVRIALGATPADVMRLVVGQGMRTPGIGIALGLVAAFVATRLMSHLLFGIGATDPATFGGVAVALTLVAAAACYFPARRATRVDAVQALRKE